MTYPGYVIQHDETDITVVKSIQRQLNAKGCGPLGVDGDYGLDTIHAVRLFQTRFSDIQGKSLTVDGLVGPVTWASLFCTRSGVAIDQAPNELLDSVLKIACSQIGIMEWPAGSNDGPDINKYQDVVGADHGKPWSMAFVYWCFDQACLDLNKINPLFKTDNVLGEWCNTKARKIPTADAKLNVALVKPGQVFIISTGGGQGHTGIVEKNESGLLTTIEGNINYTGSSDDIGVFRRAARHVYNVNIGFIEFE